METICTNITDYLLNQTWQIGILFAVVAIVCVTIRKKTAHLRYLLWLLIVAKCLVPSLITVSLAILPQQPQPEPVYVSPELAFAITLEPVIEAPDLPVRPITVPPKPTILERLAQIRPKTWFSATWLGGVSLYLLIVLIKAVRFNRRLKGQRKCLTGGMQKEIDELLDRFGVHVRLRIWLLEGIGQPFVWGLLRGSIYLPANFGQIGSREHRRGILMHEITHVVRFDAAVNCLQAIAQAIFWFHPLVWLANRNIRAEREKCCDETAIARLSAAPKVYSSAIVDTLIAEYQSTQPIPSLAIAGPIKNIEDRIKTIMKPGKKFYNRPTIIAIVTILLLAIIAVPTTIALTHRQATKPENSFEKPDVQVEGQEIEKGKTIVRGYVLGPNGKLIENATIQIREKRKPGQRSIEAPDVPTDAKGYYSFDKIEWPYSIGSIWSENLPDNKGRRHQYLRRNEFFEGSQSVDFKFDHFPSGDSILSGQVTGPNGKAVKDFTINVQNKVNWKDYSTEYLHQYGYKMPFSTADGKFKVGDLPAGEYTVNIYNPKLARRFYVWPSAEITLAEGKTTNIALEVFEKPVNVYYGQILFENGKPAFVDLPPWSGANTHLHLRQGGEPTCKNTESLLTHLADVDKEGYFTASLLEEELEQIKAGKVKIEIFYPSSEEEYVSDRIGSFPVELLAKDKSAAGVVRIKRPEPDVQVEILTDKPPVVLDLDSGKTLKVEKDWPDEYDVGWDNDEGGALFCNRSGTVKMLPISEAKHFADAASIAFGLQESLNVHGIRGVLAQESKYIAVKTSQGNIAVLEIIEYSRSKAKVKWKIIDHVKKPDVQVEGKKGKKGILQAALPVLRLEKAKYVIGESIRFWVGVECLDDDAIIPEKYWNTCFLHITRPDGTIKKESVGWPMDGQLYRGWSGGWGFGKEKVQVGKYTLVFEFANKKTEPVELIVEELDVIKKIKATFNFQRSGNISKGEHIPIILTVQNNSKHVIQFPRRGVSDAYVSIRVKRQEPSMESAFFYPIERLKGTLKNTYNWGRAVSVPPIVLQPGERFEQELSLEKAYELWGPGQYEVTFSTALALVVGEKNGKFATYCPIRLSIVATENFRVITQGHGQEELSSGNSVGQVYKPLYAELEKKPDVQVGAQQGSVASD